MNIIPKNTNILHKQSLKLSDDVVGSLEENWLAETVKMAIRQGHCPIPMKLNTKTKELQPAGTFKNAETYPLDHPRWKRADINIIGIRLDDFILLDLDLYKENATPQGEVFDIVGGEPLLVQENDKNNSPHYLFRVPVGYDKTTLKNSNVGWMPGVDLLTGNQLMHLQKHKTIIDGELPTLDDVEDAPQAIIDALTKITTEQLQKRSDSPASNTKAAEIVSHIDPDIGYDEWLTVGMGLHDEFSGGSQGLEIWDNWSADGEKYRGFSVLAYHWDSFTTGGGRTFGSVRKMAKDAGADLAKINTKYDNVAYISKIDFDDVSDTDNVVGQLESEVIHDDADLTGILGKDSPLGGYITALARETKMPVNTVFDTALSIISMVFTRSHTISYEGDTGILPIVLNLIAEQPPGTSKSRLLKALQSGVFNECKQERKRIIKELESLEKSDQTEETETAIHSLKRRRAGLFSFITDTTPEALDASLGDTNGCFALASAEQAVLNTLLGLSYGNGNAANIDLMLKGFNGEWHKSMRKSRDTFEGVVVGGFSCLAQVEVIVNALKKSGSTGLIERCMLRSEPSLIGQRDHLKKQLMDRETRTNFNSAISFLTELSFNHQTTEFEDLPTFRLTDKAWYKINVRRNELEKTIAGGGENSATLLQGAISKIDMFIVKIGAVLHGMDSLLRGNDFVPPIIEDKFIDQAIQIRDAQLAHMKGLIKNSSIVALSDRENKILDMIKSSSTGVITAKRARDKLYRASCFKHDGKYKRENVQKTIVQMQNDTLINVILKKGMNGEKDEIYLSLP